MKSTTSIKCALLIMLAAIGHVGLATAQSQQNVRLAQLVDAEGCVFPQLPSIPDAAGATMEQMVATQGAIQAYIEDSNTLLECLEGITANTDLSDEDRQLALDAYNAEVSNQESLAERWNVQRTRFLEAQKR